jgi:hypothetical protein
MARDLALERAWRKRMRQYERSGLTIKAFCDQEGLVAHQFSWWRSELKRRAAKTKTTSNGRGRRPKAKKNAKRSDAPSARFVPLHIEPTASSSVEIVLDQPPRIKVTAGFDADLLREVVRVLESRQC